MYFLSRGCLIKYTEESWTVKAFLRNVHILPNQILMANQYLWVFFSSFIVKMIAKIIFSKTTTGVHFCCQLFVGKSSSYLLRATELVGACSQNNRNCFPLLP